MPTILTHAAASMAPDPDVTGWHAGVDQGTVGGHRGLTRSRAFAAMLAHARERATTTP